MIKFYCKYLDKDSKVMTCYLLKVDISNINVVAISWVYNI